MLFRIWNAVVVTQYVMVHLLIFVDFVAGLSPSLYSRIVSASHLISFLLNVIKWIIVKINREKIRNLITMLEDGKS
jgi:hypothetical protein